MGMNYNNTNYSTPASAPVNMGYASQQLFPQPQGSVFIVNSLAEMEYAPVAQGVTNILCLPEKLLHVKTVQNGIPMTLVYKLVPYGETLKEEEEKKEESNNLEEYFKRLKSLEDKVKKLENKKGGNINEFTV